MRQDPTPEENDLLTITSPTRNVWKFSLGTRRWLMCYRAQRWHIFGLRQVFLSRLNAVYTLADLMGLTPAQRQWVLDTDWPQALCSPAEIFGIS